MYQRKRRWALDGTWQRICDTLRIDCDAEEGDDWTVGVDSTVVRAHQHAAGARQSPPAELAEPAAPAGPADKGGRQYRTKRVIVRR